MSQYVAPRFRARSLMHWLAGILVALLAVGGLSTPAFAAGGKVTIFPAQSGSDHNGMPVLTEGGTYAFQLGYGSMDDGAVVTIALPEGVTIPDAALVVPVGNTAVASLAVNEAHQLIVTFKDPFPADVNQGVLDLSFTVDTVETSEVRDLVWGVDGEQTTQRVIVTEPGESPKATTTASSKWASAVSIPHTVVDGTIVLDEAVLDTVIPYTVTVSSKDAREVSLSDTLGDHLAFVDGSLTGKKVVRDADDLNPVTTTLTGLPAISGTTFTHTFPAEQNSTYTFTYKAKIADAAALDALRAKLQAAYDAVDEVNGGSYSVSLTNQAVINGQKKQATTSVSGSVAGQERPGTGSAFSKSVDPTSVTLEEKVAAGATLSDGIPVTYTLGADLTVFAEFADTSFALERNVVIRDTLANEISWNSGDAGFLVLKDASGAEIALAPASGLSGNIETAIAADAYVNTYAVAGKTIYVNIGKDVTKTYTLTAKATIEKLSAWASYETQYETQFRADNTAYFIYADGRYETKGATTTIIVPKDTAGGVDDPSKFDKSTKGGTITVASGTSTLVPYTFTIGQGVGDASTSRIIDEIDHDVFDVTEDTLAQIQASITGTYAWNYPLDGSTFDVSLDEDGDLVIAPNAEFPKDASWGASAEAPFTGTWNITVQLPTKVLVGKQTIDILNSARYEGADQEVVFTSSSSTKATSFGNEMEVRKRVYDAVNDSFVGSVRAEIDEAGALVQDEFVYRIELLPHGSFANMVEDVVDVLPDEVEFLGFVAEGDVASGATVATVAGERYAIPGSQLVAQYDADAGTVTVERGKVTPGSTVALYFAVRVTAHEANVGITNAIGASGATITPTNEYPLSLLKRDSTDSAKLITDGTARFSVLAADRSTVVLEDLRVVAGKIVTAAGETPVVSETGSYWLREDVAPVGYEKTDVLRPIVVAADGGTADVVMHNTPGAVVEPEKTYAVGDVVWIDADKDGVQDESEQVLPGVTVELIQDGKVIGTDVTDEFGRYMFDELPAGEYQVKFTLTEEQAKIYTFTVADAGSDDAVDSDADPATGLTQTIVLGPDNTQLTHDYGWGEVRATEGIDPTWDAGVIVRQVIEPGEPGGPTEPTEPTGPSEPTEPTEPSEPTEPTEPSEGGSEEPPTELPLTEDPAHPGTPGVNELALTGGSLPLGLAGGALVLLLAGVALFAWRRRAA